jgi:hypothetical protein
MQPFGVTQRSAFGAGALLVADAAAEPLEDWLVPVLFSPHPSATRVKRHRTASRVPII